MQHCGRCDARPRCAVVGAATLVLAGHEVAGRAQSLIVRESIERSAPSPLSAPPTTLAPGRRELASEAKWGEPMTLEWDLADWMASQPDWHKDAVARRNRAGVSTRLGSLL